MTSVCHCVSVLGSAWVVSPISSKELGAVAAAAELRQGTWLAFIPRHWSHVMCHRALTARVTQGDTGTAGEGPQEPR